MCIRCLLLLLLSFSITHPVYAEIYKWVDETGAIHFSSEPPRKGKSEEIKIEVNSYSSPQGPAYKYNPSLITSRKASTNVVMYSTTRCGYCKMAKRYFNKQKIPFAEYDVEKSSKGKKDFKALNGRGVPIILVGKRRMDGFSVASFEKLYGSR